ncbi:MAG: hypothetical protein K8R88_08450 [Armatimonadetes bacterium]|nr:hypothetical protein [Armatimonadota bacterium]
MSLKRYDVPKTHPVFYLLVVMAALIAIGIYLSAPPEDRLLSPIKFGAAIAAVLVSCTFVYVRELPIKESIAFDGEAVTISLQRLKKVIRVNQIVEIQIVDKGTETFAEWDRVRLILKDGTILKIPVRWGCAAFFLELGENLRLRVTHHYH